MERSFRCPECQTVVTVPLHVFPVCTSCGYSRSGQPHEAPQWPLADEAAAEGHEGAEPMEFSAEGPQGDEGQWLAEDGQPVDGTEGTDDGQWPQAPDDGVWETAAPRSSKLRLILICAGIPFLVAGLIFLILAFWPAKAPSHSDLWGVALVAIGIIVFAVGMFTGRRPAAATPA